MLLPRYRQAALATTKAGISRVVWIVTGVVLDIVSFRQFVRQPMNRPLVQVMDKAYFSIGGVHDTELCASRQQWSYCGCKVTAGSRCVHVQSNG